MTASSADTAELPLVRSFAVATPVVPPPTTTATPVMVPPIDLSPAVPVAPDRAALRTERQRRTRERRLWALLGLSIMAVTLGLTVVVLGIAR